VLFAELFIGEDTLMHFFSSRPLWHSLLIFLEVGKEGFFWCLIFLWAVGLMLEGPRGVVMLD